LGEKAAPADGSISADGESLVGDRLASANVIVLMRMVVILIAHGRLPPSYLLAYLLVCQEA
jgi:hypothetical protein